MITISFEKRGASGLCEHIYNSIKTQILNGTLKAKEKLPSKRSLAENLGVSVITVQNAYAALISEGYIYSIEKKGFFVTELRIDSANKTDSPSPCNDTQSSPCHAELDSASIIDSDILQNDNFNNRNFFCDFQSNSTNYEKFPFNLWSHTMRQVLNSGDEKLLKRVGVKGVFELRSSISKFLHEFRNMDVFPEQIVIGAGTENLYSMVVQFLGRENLFALENPGYHKISSVIELNGAKTIPVTIDEKGISISELEKSAANVAHVSPNHHFPTGIVMPIRRRQEILAWSEKSEKRFIIEDDYDSEFRFNGKPLSTLFSSDKNGKVIYINTFSKTLAPSFRISFMVLPMQLLPCFEKQFGLYSCPVSSFEQFTLSRFINDGNYGKHIIRMKNFYRNLRNSLISAIQTSEFSKNCKIQEEESGLHFLLTIKSAHSAAELEKRLSEQKINLPLLSNFYYKNATNSNKNEENSEKTFVVNYSGIKKEKIAEIIHRLEKAFKN